VAVAAHRLVQLCAATRSASAAAPQGRLERAGRGALKGHEGWRPAVAGATVCRVSETLRLTIVYEDGGDGWIVASIPEVPGAHSQGHTRAEARENVIDALQTMLTPDEELQEPSDREALIFTAQPA
jgi:predicted RNase H-like HicB family nuclease